MGYYTKRILNSKANAFFKALGKGSLKDFKRVVSEELGVNPCQDTYAVLSDYFDAADDTEGIRYLSGVEAEVMFDCPELDFPHLQFTASEFHGNCGVIEFHGLSVSNDRNALEVGIRLMEFAAMLSGYGIALYTINHKQKTLGTVLTQCGWSPSNWSKNPHSSNRIRIYTKNLN